MGKSCCLITILVVVALVVFTFISGFIFFFVALYGRGKQITYQVTNASLTQFNLTATTNNNTLLEYGLALNITVQNPNKVGEHHFDRFDSGLVFRNQSLSNVTWYPFYLGHKKTVVLTPFYKGKRWMTGLGADEVGKFKAARVFDILLRLYVKHWTKAGGIRHYIPSARDPALYACYLKLPFNSAAQSFRVTNCVFQSKNNN